MPKHVVNLMNNQINNEKAVIIIPTYNEAAVIETTIHALFQATQHTSEFEIHILVFDSSSQDDTQSIIKRMQANYPTLHLFSETEKSGLGSAYHQAMEIAIDKLHADIVCEYDADGSHQPKYLLPMLNMLKSHDAVIGSRYVKGGKIPQDWGIHRKLFSVMGNWMARAVLHPKYRDYTSGFRATRTTLLKRILPNKFLSNQYAYKLHLFWLLHKAGAKIAEYPIEFIDRTLGESKLPANSVKDALRVIFTLRFKELRKYFKMCSVGALGAVVQLTIYNQLRKVLPPYSAAQISVSSAILSNFILNHLYTFKGSAVDNIASQSTKFARQLVLFCIYSIAMIQLQSNFVFFGLKAFGQGRLLENLLLCFAIALGSLLNYFVYSKYIWPFEVEKTK